MLCTKQREGEDDLGGGGGRSVGIVFFSCYHEMGLGMVFAVFFFVAWKGASGLSNLLV